MEMNDMDDMDELDELEPIKRTESSTKTEEKQTTHGTALWKRVMRGDLLAGHVWKDQMGLIMLIVVCLMVIVTMRYRVESLQKERLATEERIKVLREDRLHMQKMYQESVKISRIEQKLDTLGIGLISGPPYAI